MTPKRGDRVAPPAVGAEWDLRFLSNQAAQRWEDLARQVPENLRRAYDVMLTAPNPEAPTSRHHRLKGDMSTARKGGEDLPRFQYEVTAGGRIWYLLDENKHQVLVEYAGTGHPKATE